MCHSLGLATIQCCMQHNSYKKGELVATTGPQSVFVLHLHSALGLLPCIAAKGKRTLEPLGVKMGASGHRGSPRLLSYDKNCCYKLYKTEVAAIVESTRLFVKSVKSIESATFSWILRCCRQQQQRQQQRLKGPSSAVKYDGVSLYLCLHSDAAQQEITLL